MVRLPIGLVASVVCVTLLTGQMVNAATPSKSSSSAPLIRLSGHVLPALAKAETVSPQSKAAADEPLTLTLGLKRDDQSGFERYLHDVYDSSSPNYRKFLSQKELAARFGPSQKNYDAVLRYLRENGFTLVEGSANRLTLTVRGSRAQAEQAFRVEIKDYRIKNLDFFANDSDPALPKELVSHVTTVVGLSNLAKPQMNGIIDGIVNGFEAIVASLNCLACAVGTAGGLGFLTFDFDMCVTAKKLKQSYSGPGFDCKDPPAPNDWRSIDGTGQTVGLLEFDTFNQSDVVDYLALIGAPATQINNLTQVHVDGGATPGANQAEVLLDIDDVMSIAPGAKVVVYDAPFTGSGRVSFQQILNAMIDGGVNIISNSWAYCEDQTTAPEVQILDAILQSAAAAGISVFSAAGDTGSTCLDGSANTAAVPADSPNVTAVGGTSLKVNPGPTYESETWWNGSGTSSTSQGGFGVSQFFSRPSYQSGLSSSAGRSVPDVVVNADPALGVSICQASAGGCPSNLIYGGTSSSAPTWAAFVALLNQAAGQELGFLNPMLYPLANSAAFQSAASMGSDFAHVGLGSPNLNALKLILTGQTPGAPSAAQSDVYFASKVKIDVASVDAPSIPADGVAQGSVVVRLRDANGNLISGKTVALAANTGSTATISPPTGVSAVPDGAVIFTVTNLTPETATFTATDVTDGIVLQQTASLPFSTPPATGASINAFPTTVTADGVATTTITVTLKDALNRPTPGKLITLSQGNGHSLITGPDPSVTDVSGQIQFFAADLVNEVVTYSAVDVTDGDLPVPGNPQVTFTNGSGGACGQNTPLPVGLNGYTVTPFANGFATGTLFFSNVNYVGCSGVSTPGFLNDSVYIPDFFNGDLFKVGLGGGAVSNANRLTTIGPTLGWPVVSKAGRLYATRAGTGGNFNTGVVLELDPNTGSVLRTVASNLTCANSLVADPLSGDLFFDDQCFGAGNDPSLFRLRNPDSANPTLEVYATLPSSPNGQIVFAPNGTIYVVSNYLQPSPAVVRVSGTDGPTPPTVTTLPGVSSTYWVNIGSVDAAGEARTLITLSGGKLQLTDITTNPPTTTVELADQIGGGIIGPDGCLYMPNQNAVYKLTDPTGGCSFLPTNAVPSITLTPTVVAPNPEQGSAQTFTATFRNVTVSADTPVFFQVAGVNAKFQLVRTDTNGQAVFTYTAFNEGADKIVATATVNNIALTSNTARVSWAAGKHVTFLTLNPSPTTAIVGTPVSVIASLSDVSVSPPVPLANEAVSFSLGSGQCFGTADAQGVATCQLTPSVVGMSTLTATFAGAAQFVESTASIGFNVLPEPPPPPPPPSEARCPIVRQFWKRHPAIWPVTSLTLGEQTYSQTELLTLLKHETIGKVSVLLARRLIAVKLNIAFGSNPEPIAATILDADQLLSAFNGKLPYKVKKSSKVGKEMHSAAEKLKDYNGGKLTRPCKKENE